MLDHPIVQVRKYIVEDQRIEMSRNQGIGKYKIFNCVAVKGKQFVLGSNLDSMFKFSLARVEMAFQFKA